MYTLIAFATQWGSRHGGINSFNADFLTNFGAAYHQGVKIICVVTDHTAVAADEAAKAHVRLVALPYIPKERSFDSSIGELSVDLIRKANITFEPNETVWLGHDLITGEAAVGAARVARGRSAVIHHMSYSAYESYAEDSESAQRKTDKQAAILQQADLVLAIGPLLRDAAIDRVGACKWVHMLVPGLPEIDPKEAPKTFVAFLSGRLTVDAARIKQGHLGVAAFAEAEMKARRDGLPEALKRQPKLLLRGIDFENRVLEADLNTTPDPETELKKFAEEYANGVVNLHALPYTEDRQQLYSELSGASVALMPSWHEGFGLVAWEAIAAGIPLIVGENTGVYRLLDEEYSGAQKGFIDRLDVRGQSEFPYFRPEDLETTVVALRNVAIDAGKARKRASMLRNMLLEKFTWANCCEDAVRALGWNLQRGSIGDRTSEIVKEISEQALESAVLVSLDGPLQIPQRQWRAAAGMADSQLLRAEEELLPFDTRRQPDVDRLTAWAADTKWPLTVRLITGDGGQGKTRLAIRVCQQLRVTGWHTGFLDSGLEENRMPQLLRDLARLNQPSFIVVDYAETRQRAFLALLKAVLQHPLPKPVRLLLLARDGGEWWNTLPSVDPFCEPLLIGPATTGPFKLAPLYVQHQDRQQAFTKALNAFVEILATKNPGITPQLVGDQFERPLFIQMAALLALYGERPTTVQGLTKALLNHERRYWVGLLASLNWPDPGRHAEELLALATLAGGFGTAKVAETFWRTARDAALTTGEFSALFGSLSALYPGTQGLQALRPDLLGEALVAQAILRPDGDVLLDAVLSTAATQSIRRNALTVLARLSNERVDTDETIVAVLSRQFSNCAADLIAVSTETASRLPELAEQSLERLTTTVKNQVIGSLRQSLPDQSIQLAGLSCVVFKHLVEKSRERLERKGSNRDRLFEYCEALDGYGSALFQTGRYDTANEAAQIAVKTSRELISKDRKRYDVTLAGRLSNYALYLSKVGQDEKALMLDREALSMYEHLMKTDRKRFEPRYAHSLDRYAVRLGEIGKLEEATDKAKLAVDITERLMKDNPSRFDDLRAVTLTNYAGHLNDAGKPDEALKYSKEALEIRYKLAQKNPDRFEFYYAMCLRNCAVYLTDMGSSDEALVYVRQAYRIYNRLWQKQPKRFGADLFIATCSITFLTWLINERGDEEPLESVFKSVPYNDQGLMRIYWTFSDACRATEYNTRQERFHLIPSIWNNLSDKNRKTAARQRFCTAAWLDKFDSKTETAWHTDWAEYVEKRNGHVPAWMLEVARRLDFKFPS